MSRCIFLSASKRPRSIGVLFAVLVSAASASSVSCPVAASHPPSDAEQAYLTGNYDSAANLYQQQIQQKPSDPAPIAGLAQTLLRQDKVKEAGDLVQKALGQDANSVVLLASLGMVQYRDGAPWLASATAARAMKIDPCYPQLRLLNARLLKIQSQYASAAKEIEIAHVLDPHDPAIRLQWLEAQPISRRISELDSYLSARTGDDSRELRDLRSYLDYLRKEEAGPRKQCRMVSTTATTAIDFIRLMRDANDIRAFGLDVKINDHSARLEIDTGAAGLTISRPIAEKAGLIKAVQGQLGGVGDHGAANAYSAYADDIRIGGMEFRDCEVHVLDQRSVVGSDGLIGMDVFSNFLVTLDYPMRKLILGPLPSRPDDAPGVSPALETSGPMGEEGNVTSAGSGSAAAGAAAAPGRPTGPHDRYVAPEMRDWTPVYRVGHTLILPISLNDKARKLFILDTGAFHTSITNEAAREVSKVRTQDALEVRGIGGKVEKVYSADEIVFKFGKMAVRSIDVPVFDTPFISQSIGMEESGFVGFSTLGQMTVKIDYRDGLVDFSSEENRGFKQIVPSY